MPLACNGPKGINCLAEFAHFFRWSIVLYSTSALFVLLFFFFASYSRLHHCQLSFRRPNRKVSHGKINGPFPFMFCLLDINLSIRRTNTTPSCRVMMTTMRLRVHSTHKKQTNEIQSNKWMGTYVKMHILCVRSHFTYHIISMRCSFSFLFRSFCFCFFFFSCICFWFSMSAKKKIIFFFVRFTIYCCVNSMVVLLCE